MLQFEDFLTEQEREIRPRASKAALAKDENAFIHLGNYAIGEFGQKTSIEKLDKAISDAINDPDHELSFRNAPKEAFTGGVKNSASRRSWYDQLRGAVHLIDSMSKHPDWKPFFQKGYAFAGTGRRIATVSKDWTDEGAKQGITGTAKADAITIIPTGQRPVNRVHKRMPTLSLKQKEALSASAAPAETAALLRVSLKAIKKRMSAFDFEAGNQIIDKIKKLQQNKENVPKLNKLLGMMYDRFDHLGFGDALHREAITAEKKLVEPWAKVTHVGTLGDEGAVRSIEEHLFGEGRRRRRGYFTLPKHRPHPDAPPSQQRRLLGDPYAVFRVPSVDVDPEVRKKKREELKAQAKAQAAQAKQKEKESHRLSMSDHVAGGEAWFGPGERQVFKLPEPKNYKAIKSGMPEDEIRKPNTGAGSRMAWIKGAVRDTVRQKAQPKPTTPKEKIPWARIQPHYLKGELSVDEIGKQFNVNPATIKWHAGVRGWRRGAN